uniref:BLTX485 n=1 Tax=Nephila pilipes TaxID=299642 RepID=A0A076L2K5_NEPPI|nr:BLTX485 [Nephila pilipes]
MPLIGQRPQKIRLAMQICVPTRQKRKSVPSRKRSNRLRMILIRYKNNSLKPIPNWKRRTRL